MYYYTMDIIRLKNLLCGEFLMVNGEKVRTAIPHKEVERIIDELEGQH
jgi:hypothetical protein